MPHSYKSFESLRRKLPPVSPFDRVVLPAPISRGKDSHGEFVIDARGIPHYVPLADDSHLPAHMRFGYRKKKLRDDRQFPAHLIRFAGRQLLKKYVCRQRVHHKGYARQRAPQAIVLNHPRAKELQRSMDKRLALYGRRGIASVRVSKKFLARRALNDLKRTPADAAAG